MIPKSDLEARLLDAYRKIDDVAYDAVIQELLNAGAFLPSDLNRRVEQYFESNPNRNVRCGWFPLGMVQRWIERAEVAEQKRGKLCKMVEALRHKVERLNFHLEYASQMQVGAEVIREYCRAASDQTGLLDVGRLEE